MGSHEFGEFAQHLEAFAFVLDALGGEGLEFAEQFGAEGFEGGRAAAGGGWHQSASVRVVDSRARRRTCAMAENKSSWDAENVALLAIADAIWNAIGEEVTTGTAGPITEAVRATGIRLGPGVVEAVVEWMFWDGVRQGLRAAHDANVRESLRSMALRFPGILEP
jgi:hypothetical protein